MLDIKVQIKVPCSEIRKQNEDHQHLTKYIVNQKKWKWSGHTARVKDNILGQALQRVATQEMEKVKRTTKLQVAR